ncbi:hypothetical protein BDK51DRAFT_41236 [Blyttiomyces helicus]|uniref:Helicase C-terminal domain-containing protein n=1 Tax=Blyttiomyces helicus TaxID=388810 RepID=A0A4P9W686_9FUNG|nr:hypothetical protein BDK51DRAFT_41236 [Blyttiomyces helicus]|eukprot:RKO86873.1 hypothetical protein BDK51DRAFT_41236 [Blyttiomyces helicus]
MTQYLAGEGVSAKRRSPLSSRPGSGLYDPFRRLHLTQSEGEVQDGRYAPTRVRRRVVDSKLSKYSAIVFYEAHERTVSTDELYGLLEKNCRERPDMRLIVYPRRREVLHLLLRVPDPLHPSPYLPRRSPFTNDPESVYLDSALITVSPLGAWRRHPAIPRRPGRYRHRRRNPLLTHEGPRLMIPELIVLSVYSALPSEMQSQIFEPAPPGSRKVVIATNIAEDE